MKQRKNLEKRLKENRFNEFYIAEAIALDFSVCVNNVLEDRGITRKELADRMGCSKPYITQVLDGNTNLTFKTLGKIASALQMDIKAPELFYKDMISFEAFKINSSASVTSSDFNIDYKNVG